MLKTSRNNPLRKLKITELREEELRLRSQAERLRKNIQRVERKKKNAFESGIGADSIRKKMLAQEIQHFDVETKIMLRDFRTMQKQAALLSNLIWIKKYEQRLEKTALWKKLTSVSANKLENALINANLGGRAFEDALDDLNRVFEVEAGDADLFEDDSERQLMDAWNSVESGAVDVEQAEKVVSFDKMTEPS